MPATAKGSSDPYRLRLARPAEIDAIRRIEQAAAQRFRGTSFAWVAEAEPGGSGRLMASVKAQSLLVAVDAGDRPVGFLQVMMIDGAAYIEEVDVLPDHAGHRLGARLIDAAEPWARHNNLQRLTLSTFRDIPWNAPYYRRLGFQDLHDLTPGLRRIRDRHRRIGLRDADRVFMWRSVRAVPSPVGDAVR
jgi:GNAT superfamily N-acetyltransferase